MVVLIVDSVDENRAELVKLLEDFEDFNIVEATSDAHAVQLCTSIAVDIVLLSISHMPDESITAIKAIRRKPNKPMVVAISDLSDDYSKSLIMGAGATDYFTKPINEKLFFVRLKNYEALLKSTHDRAGTNEWAINPFASKVYSRKTVFRVTKESSLGEFWEYFILKQNILTKDMSDCVKAIYNTGLVLLKSHKLFDIIVEEDDETFYFTIVKIDGYNKKKIKAIFENEFPQSTRKLGEGALSLILKKSIFELENAYYDTDIKLPMPQAEQKKIDYNMPVYEEDESKRILRHSFVEKTTASAFLSEIDETYLDKIDALEVTEDDLDSDIFELETSGKIDYVYKIAHSMIDYADAVEAINEFGNITYALYRLAENLINLKSADIDEKKLAKLTLMLKSLHADLTQWRANIFVTKITQDIHYLDSSLISSCMQIDYIFKDVQVIDEDGDLELF